MRKKILFTSLLISILLFSNLIYLERVNASDGIKLFYTVTVEKGKDTAHISVELSNLYTYKLEFGFWVHTIEKYIKNLKVKTKNGTLISTTPLGNSKWEVSTSQKNIVIEYDIKKIIPYVGGLPNPPKRSEVAVYIDDIGGLLIGEYFFIVPFNCSEKNIKIKFDLPQGWSIVCPYLDRGTLFEVPKITNNLINNFLKRQGVYFGEMKYYSERKVDHCTIKFGKLENDEQSEISSQEDIDFYVQRTAEAVKKFTKIFGENPYPIFSMYTNFRNEGYSYPGTREIAGGYQYWPPDRYDELIGHLQYSWFSFPNQGDSPISANDFIAKGLGESYLSCKIAYEITGDKHYLGKIYYYYLVYKRALGNKYMSKHEIGESYYKGAVFGIYLDKLIQEETNGSKSIEDVFGYLYKKYKNSGKHIKIKELKEAVNAITNKDHSAIFNKYVYGNEEIPVDNYIGEYMSGFDEFLKVLESNEWGRPYRSHAIPFFIDIEMAIPLSGHIPFGILCMQYQEEFAEYVRQNYNIDVLTKGDVEDALSELTGEDCSGFFTRWENSYGRLSLDELKSWLKGKYYKNGISFFGAGSQVIVVGNNTPDIEYAETLEEELNPSIGNVRFLIGGPVANDWTKRYIREFSKEVSNEYPGTGRGIIEVKEIGGIIYVLLAGSDRDGTNAAVQIFLELEKLPDKPIIVDWNDGDPRIIEE